MTFFYDQSCFLRRSASLLTAAIRAAFCCVSGNVSPSCSNASTAVGGKVSDEGFSS